MVPMVRIYIKRDNVIAERLNAGLVLTRLGTDRLLILNGTAQAIWDQIDGCNSIDTVISRLADQFRQSPEVILKDVTAFIEQLLARDLIIEMPL